MGGIMWDDLAIDECYLITIDDSVIVLIDCWVRTLPNVLNIYEH